MIFCKSKTAMGSIPENGSSSRMKVGLIQSDRAISTRLRSPLLARPQVHGNAGDILFVVQHPTGIGRNQAYNCIEGSSFSGAVRAQQADHFTLLYLKADSVYYPPATISFADFVGGQGVHLSCHSRPGCCRGRVFAFHEHPIIASKESQRIAGNLAMFGIKNARGTARQDEFVVGSKVLQSLSGRSSGGLRDHDIAIRNNPV